MNKVIRHFNNKLSIWVNVHLGVLREHPNSWVGNCGADNDNVVENEPQTLNFICCCVKFEKKFATLQFIRSFIPQLKFIYFEEKMLTKMRVKFTADDWIAASEKCDSWETLIWEKVKCFARIEFYVVVFLCILKLDRVEMPTEDIDYYKKNGRWNRYGKLSKIITRCNKTMPIDLAFMDQKWLEM